MNVDSILKIYLDEQIKQAQQLHPTYSELWTHIADLALGGGKRLRPRLVIETYKKYGGQDVEKILLVAAAWELLHVGLLIHDDIMDGDLERRGKPTIEAIYGDANVALLAGSLCTNAAGELVLKSLLSNYLKLKIIPLLQTCYKQTISGQLLDIDGEKHDPLLVAQYKTAMYSFVGPMLSGAMAAGAKKKDLLALRETGIKLGIAYQLQNDLEDVEQDLAAGRHSSVIQAMEDLGSLEEAKVAIEQVKHSMIGGDGQKI